MYGREFCNIGFKILLLLGGLRRLFIAVGFLARPIVLVLLNLTLLLHLLTLHATRSGLGRQHYCRHISGVRRRHSCQTHLRPLGLRSRHICQDISASARAPPSPSRDAAWTPAFRTLCSHIPRDCDHLVTTRRKTSTRSFQCDDTLIGQRIASVGMQRRKQRNSTTSRKLFGTTKTGSVQGDRKPPVTSR